MQKHNNHKIRVNLNNLIEVFDEHNNKYIGHTTSIIGLIGEDLNAAIFADYLIRRKIKKNVKILPYPVKVHRMGPELDRWIKADKILYQAEIKSWCSFQIGWYKLLLKTTEQNIKTLAKAKWENVLREQFHGMKDIKNLGHGSAGKVLVKMKIPDEIKGYKIVKPLIIHWMPISSNGETPFFSHPIKDLKMGKQLTNQIQKYFSEINYFSCSLYIRELIREGKKKIELNLPNFEVRMSIINKLIN